MATERLMSHEAFVIERTLNGIIVRPHLGWWRNDGQHAFAVTDIRVFNDLKDFERWFSQWFPVERSE